MDEVEASDIGQLVTAVLVARGNRVWAALDRF